MALKLTIDQGNSATKAAVWNDDCIVAEQVYRDIAGVDIDVLARKFGEDFDASIYSTVRMPDRSIIARMKLYSRRFIELNESTPLPIGIAYDSPSTLGRDRIAAAVGAHDMAPDQWILVVDLGTAITYDVVSPEGVFVGGNIAPGIFMRLEALNHYTARLPLVETSGECPTWGHNTETALRAGAVNGVVAELRYYRSLLPQTGTTVILTGGSADLVASKTGFDLTVDHNLVAKGLNSIINFNLSTLNEIICKTN